MCDQTWLARLPGLPPDVPAVTTVRVPSPCRGERRAAHVGECTTMTTVGRAPPQWVGVCGRVGDGRSTRCPNAGPLQRLDLSPHFPAFRRRPSTTRRERCGSCAKPSNQPTGAPFSAPRVRRRHAGSRFRTPPTRCRRPVRPRCSSDRSLSWHLPTAAPARDAIEQVALTRPGRTRCVVSTCRIPAPRTIGRPGAVTDAAAMARLHRSGDALLARSAR